MKLKFLLVPLAVLGLAVGSYADCSKDEILKLIDKGFSKSEIKGICNKSESKPKGLSWVTPSDKTCKANGGKIDEDGICEAKWMEAKDICRASGGRLPDRYELKQVIVDCGGTVDDSINNKANSAYQSCYKRKGFSSSNGYWSSSTVKGDEVNAWFVLFNYGFEDGFYKDLTFAFVALETDSRFLTFNHSS